MNSKITDVLEQITKCAARTPKLARNIAADEQEPDAVYSILRDALGAIEVLNVYLEIEGERVP